MSISRIRTHIQSIDPAVWLVLALCLIAAWPFIFRTSLPRETDAELHVFRAAEVGFNIREGALYSRWAPDFYYGYGYPIFNYYAPLTYYLANLLTLALPGGAVLGVKLVFILGFLIAGYSVYYLGLRFSSRFGGLIAAACYLFAPYFYLIDPHLRGDLAEFFALAVGPLAFWQLTRHIDSPRSQTLMLSTLSIAAIIVTHNLLALVFFAMLGTYVLGSFMGRLDRPPSFSAAVVRVAPLLLALLISAFFWLPVMLEQEAVQLSNLIGPGHFDFRNHFLSPGELLAPSLPLDLGSVNPKFRLNLGLAQWGLALVGLLAGIGQSLPGRISDAQRRHTLSFVFWALSGLSLIVLMLPVSDFLWEAIPQMAFLQFPWRLLGPVNLCLALLAAKTADLPSSILSRRTRNLTFAVFLTLPLIASLPVFSPPAWETFGSTDRTAILDFELSGIALGTTATGDFVPVDVELVPGPNPDLIESYQGGSTIDKVNRRTLPVGASVEVLSHSPTVDIFSVQSPEPFILRIYTFMFAGWKASLDGSLVDIEVAQPEGFITVPVPAGNHEVRVFLGTTPARNIATGLTVIGLIMMTLTARMIDSQTSESSVTETDTLFDLRFLAGTLGVFVLIAGIGSLTGLFQPRSSALDVAGADYQDHHYVEGGADMLGYDVSTRTVQPGDELEVTLHWKAREPIAGNFQSFVHMTTEPQVAWAQSDNLNPGDLPTTRWPLDKYVRDEHRFSVPLGTPPGTYTLRAGLWNHLTGVRQLILEEDGTVLGDSIELAIDITVETAAQPPSQNAIDIEHPLNIEVNHEIKLLGFDITPERVLDFSSGYLLITLYWDALTQPSVNYDLNVRLLNLDSETESMVYEDRVGGHYPTSTWGPGDIVRDRHALWIGPEVAPGIYQLQLTVEATGSDNSGNWLDLIDLERESAAP